MQWPPCQIHLQLSLTDSYPVEQQKRNQLMSGSQQKQPPFEAVANGTRKNVQDEASKTHCGMLF